jgi:hypothetical protein
MAEFSYWDRAKECIPEYAEGNQAFERFAYSVAKAAHEAQVPEQDFRRSTRQIFEAYGYFIDATNAYSKAPKERVHWHNHFHAAKLSKKMGEPAITQELLSSAAREYLTGPLRSPLLDRGLIDAFIAQETFAYIDRNAGRGAFLAHAGFYAFLLIGGSVLAAVLGRDTDWERLWWVMLGVVVIVGVVWAWPRTGAFALHRAMKDTYQLLTGSVVSVSELRHRVNFARDRGVVWPSELYAVLDDVESRTKFV